MSFGSMIKKLRKEHALTQDQLANRLNVTPQAISRWETNAAMPDISLLVPLANLFNVSTDTLLEVDVPRNEEHIRDFCEHVWLFEDPYGKTLDEKLHICREEIRKHPDSVNLKETLHMCLHVVCHRKDSWPNLSLYRELADLTEDIIAAGGGKEGLETYQRYLVEYSSVLSNHERASEIIRNAPEMCACKEVLLPLSLSGRAQIDARKALIFKCANTIIREIYAMYGDNAEDLTDQEWAALACAERIISTLYGQSFSDYFVLSLLEYKAVQGALKRGQNDQAIQRLRQIVDRLQFRNRSQPVNSPLVDSSQFDDLCWCTDTMYSVPLDAMMIIKQVILDFPFDNLSSYRQVNPQFDAVCNDLGKLLDIGDQERQNTYWETQEKAYKSSDTTPLN